MLVFIYSFFAIRISIVLASLFAADIKLKKLAKIIGWARYLDYINLNIANNECVLVPCYQSRNRFDNIGYFSIHMVNRIAIGVFKVHNIK